MWAQLIRMRLKPDKDTAELAKEIRAAEQPGSGLVRSLVMHDQADPTQVYALAVFESEEKARRASRIRVARNAWRPPGRSWPTSSTVRRSSPT